MDRSRSIDRISDLFMVGFSGTDAEEQLIPLLENHKLTSFILFKHNVRDAADMGSMIKKAGKRARSKGLPRPMFAADEEGGLISPMGDAFGRFPSAMAMAAGGSRDRVARATTLVGKRLRKAGLDLVLAPVLDVNSEPSNPVIGTRSFGDNKLMVSAYGAAAIQGFRSAGLLCCAKHFPGHGRTSVDSHKGLPEVDSSAEEMLNDDLVPFYRACQLDVDAAMTAHVAYPKIDDLPNRPATVSKLIQTDILRNELKFKGTLLSDSIEMKGLSDHLPPEDACVEALKAGVDMFICVDPTLAFRCIGRLEKASSGGEVSPEILERALSNVASLRKRAVGGGGSRKSYQDISRSPESEPEDRSLQEILDECYEASITAVNWTATLKRELASARRGLLILPDRLPGYEKVDPYLVSVALASLELSNSWRVISYPFDPSDEDIGQIVERVLGCDKLVLCTMSRGPEPEGQRRLVRETLKTGRISLAAALLDPYSLGRLYPGDLPKVASFGFWPESLKSLVSAVFGVSRPQGSMPIDMNRPK